MTTAEVFAFSLLLAGLLPAFAVAGVSPVSFFLAPLIGAVMAALGVELELAISGSLIDWFVVLAVIVNTATMASWLLRRTGPAIKLDTASVLGFIVLVGVLAEPLFALRAHMIGYDANAIWTTHTLMVAGGHHVFSTSLQNPAYRFSNPDYPPLVPAVGALGYAVLGHVDLILGPELTALLNACAVGVVGMGLLAICRNAAWHVRGFSIVIAAAVCVVAFALAGDYAVDGYADLLWSAAAAGAVLWGLVLPRDRSALLVAWTCAIVASLTKNEGLITALLVLALIALRYQLPPMRPSMRHAAHSVRKWSASAKGLAFWSVMVLIPAVPGLVWVLEMKALGVQDSFFSSSTSESRITRASAALPGMLQHLEVLPVALIVGVIGWFWFLKVRRGANLGHPGWLLGAWAAATVFIFLTYVFGTLEIHWWLQTSVYRTMIFSQLVLFLDIAIWALVAATYLARSPGDEEADESSIGQRKRQRRPNAVMAPPGARAIDDAGTYAAPRRSGVSAGT